MMMLQCRTAITAESSPIYTFEHCSVDSRLDQYGKQHKRAGQTCLGIVVVEKIEVDSQLPHTLKSFPEHKPGGMSQAGEFTQRMRCKQRQLTRAENRTSAMRTTYTISCVDSLPEKCARSIQFIADPCSRTHQLARLMKQYRTQIIFILIKTVLHFVSIFFSENFHVN